ncbi:MAG TPA: 4-hydroxy-tetrahydrodipicolinate synthase [Chitinophagaceae bacterium]|jgi:dihydrodipicolinate synthase
MNTRDQLRGTGVALVTPFKSDGAIDFESLEKLINFVIDGGVEYLVTLGTTGETPVLTVDEKRSLVEFTFKIADNRVPVVVGVGGNNTRAVINELEALPLHEAAAILSAGPYYNKPSQEGIYQHFKAIAKASVRPVILYNVPGRTGCNISAETTLRLAKVENIVGIKEASGNMIQCMHILRDKPADFFVTSGDDHLAMPLIACGMDGVISVAANCVPKDFANMVRASLDGDYLTARALHNKLLQCFDLLFAENNPAGVKAFLSESGIIENYFRLPLVPLSENLHAQVKEYIENVKTSMQA